MNSMLTKFAVFSISFAVGIAAASLWSNYGPLATQKSDARLLRSVQSYDDPYERGKIDAANDIRNGKLKVKRPGLPVVHDRYSEMLWHKYGIETVDYGCVGPSGYIRGYNEVSKAAIETRFGVGILDRTREQINQDYRRSKLH